MICFKGDKVRVLDEGTGVVADVRFVGEILYYEITMTANNLGAMRTLYARPRALTLYAAHEGAKDVMGITESTDG